MAYRENMSELIFSFISINFICNRFTQNYFITLFCIFVGYTSYGFFVILLFSVFVLRAEFGF